MPSPFGNFGISTVGKPSLAKKFLVFQKSPEDVGILIVACQTPKEAQRYCEYLNAVIRGDITIPRNRRNWR